MLSSVCNQGHPTLRPHLKVSIELETATIHKKDAQEFGPCITINRQQWVSQVPEFTKMHIVILLPNHRLSVTR